MNDEVDIVKMQSLPVLPFTMLLQTETPDLDPQLLLDLTKNHMTNSFLDTIPEELYFDRLILKLETNWGRQRRRLQEATNLFKFEGKALFNTNAVLSNDIVTNSTIRAFEGKYLIDFENALRISDIDVVESSVYINDISSRSDRFDVGGDEDAITAYQVPLNDKRITFFIWGLVGTTCLAFLVLMFTSLRRKNDMSYAWSLHDSLSSQGRSIGSRSQYSFDKSIQTKESKERPIPSSKVGGHVIGSFIHDTAVAANSANTLISQNIPRSASKESAKKFDTKPWFQNSEKSISPFQGNRASMWLWQNGDKNQKKYAAWFENNSDSQGIEVVDAFENESDNGSRSMFM